MIETGMRVAMTSDGETYTGTVTGVREHRVAKTGRGSGAGQGDRNGINTRVELACEVKWDGVDGTGEYRESELTVI